MLVREQVVDCSTKNPSEVCVISERRALNQFLTSRLKSSNLPSTSNDPAGMPPSRVALRLGVGCTSIRRDIASRPTIA